MFKPNEDDIKVNGLWVYSYRTRKRKGKLWCVADPNHNYPYECYGITLAGSILSKGRAIELAKWFASLDRKSKRGS